MREKRQFAVCHPARKHHSKGLCGMCSQRYWRAVRGGEAPAPELAEIYSGSDAREASARSKARAERDARKAAGLTQARARQLFAYDPETGLIIWRTPTCQKVRAGDRAGYVDDRGYVRIEIDGRAYRAHQIAWLIVTGAMVDEIDHKDGNLSNNRWGNLRVATHSQNMHNRGLLKSNTSGFKGVSFHRPSGKWRAKIAVDGVVHVLGLYRDKRDAAEAYRRAAIEMVGDFARVA